MVIVIRRGRLELLGKYGMGSILEITRILFQNHPEQAMHFQSQVLTLIQITPKIASSLLLYIISRILIVLKVELLEDGMLGYR